MTTSILGLSTNFGGIMRMRASILAAITAFDALAAPMVTTDATAAITLTAATHFTNANGKKHKDAILYSSSAVAVAAGMTKTQSDLLPIGATLTVVQSAGAVTITGSGGVTFTARGVVAGGRTARAVKVSAALWLIDYPALSA